MTSSRVDAAVPAGARTLDNQHGLAAHLTGCGTLQRLEVHGTSVLLHPADALADGPAGLWLRRRESDLISYVSLLGQTTPTRPRPDAVSTADRSGRWGPLAVAVSLRLSEERPAWYWHITVTNTGLEPVEVDLVHAQDVALAPLVAVRTNEYYVSQYLDLTPVDVPGHGVALAVRQNMPGPTPWLLIGCLGRADRWATDALQLTGRGRPEAAGWPGLAAELPAARLQGEHTLAALQTEPVELAPGETWSSGFYGLYLADHPDATSDVDARHGQAALADPAATPPQRVVPTATDDGQDHRSLFGTAAALACRPLSTAELQDLVGPDWREPELDGRELLSFFTAAGEHVVTAAKQARVLRPHGHILSSATTLLPDESSVCATVWMDGTFCSQLTQGHVSLGAVMSVRRSYLGLAPAHGLRLFVRPLGGTPWRLLGTPSAWSVSGDGCRWWYASTPAAGSEEAGLLEVSTGVPAGSDQVQVTVRVLDGSPVELLAAAHVPWLDLDGPVGTRTTEPDGIRLTPAADSRTAELYPGGSVHLGWTSGGAGAGAVAGDDSPLFLDGSSRGLPWATLRTTVDRPWTLTITPQLVPATPSPSGGRGSATGPTDRIALAAPDTVPGRELNRIATVLPWFTHDALIHYLAPRGLEQYTGGAWGTRDVSQGPVGLLLALDATAELRSLVLMIFRAQQVRGDWPQAFDFLERHRHEGESDAHGDVLYWPLLALADYLATTGDDSILLEPVPFSGPDGPTTPSSVAEHVRAALRQVETTLIPGTSLPAYGHGDWNDSLQPVDPELAARMSSAWTGVLQAQALGALGDTLSPIDGTQDLGRRAAQRAQATTRDLRRLLLVDGVLAGYGLMGAATADSASAGAGVELMIHPHDQRTGLRYSILAMIHAISTDLLTPDEAASHLRLIRDHLLGPDGARLFDRPVDYAGGPMTLFQRAEASTFFGREIGIMYMHAHLRYAEALARVGDGPGLLRALALAQPVGVTDRLPSARPRQSTCYYSSSDAAFPDRYAARDGYPGIVDGTVALEGGWRVYSSGPGLFLQLLVQRLLGIRRRGPQVHLDPVLDPGLDGLSAGVALLGESRQVRYRVGPKGHGVRSVRVGSTTLVTSPLPNPYRTGGVSVSTDDLLAATATPDAVIEIETW